MNESMPMRNAEEELQNSVRRCELARGLMSKIVLLVLGVLWVSNLAQTGVNSFVLIEQQSFVSSFVPRCKYSVRDVAFVNVHGKAWQLQLVKPSDIDEDKFHAWNAVLQSKLQRSNLGHIWYEPVSPEAKSIAQFVDEDSDLPQMVLRNQSEVLIPVQGESTFEATIDNLIDSELRDEILNVVVDSLCVFVLIESSDCAKNEAAMNVVNTAVERVNKQMWTLEKPTDQGPAVVVCEHQKLDCESLALESLGIADVDEPQLAIVYGQVRRLGEVLSGEDLSVEKIIGRASVCGSDCECDLNRDWLYGEQMVHDWSQDLERAAEATLNFDPNSAFVMAEVSQIIQKNSTDQTGSSRVDLGGGLVVHDLDLGSGEAADLEVQLPKNVKQLKPESALANDAVQVQTEVVFPWRLFLILGGVAIAAFVFFMARLT